jgi:hypothetical protein
MFTRRPDLSLEALSWSWTEDLCVLCVSAVKRFFPEWLTKIRYPFTG